MIGERLRNEGQQSRCAAWNMPNEYPSGLSRGSGAFAVGGRHRGIAIRAQLHLASLEALVAFLSRSAAGRFSPAKAAQAAGGDRRVDSELPNLPTASADAAGDQ
jgi:hypothetical protein